MENRLVEFDKWKNLLQNWAQKINAKFTISHDVSMGMPGDAYTIEIKYKHNNLKPISISQNGSGSKYEVVPWFVIFRYIDESLINFNLSFYQKGFFERIFSNKKIKSENKLFNKKFGIYSSDKGIALRLFNDINIQNIFLKNKFLILNIQKNKSIVTFKSMEIKLYEIQELNQLLEDFIYILNVLNDG